MVHSCIAVYRRERTVRSAAAAGAGAVRVLQCGVVGAPGVALRAVPKPAGVS